MVSTAPKLVTRCSVADKIVCMNQVNVLQGSSDKLNGQLKMHLDSIFDGFQKLISGTEETQERRQLPFVIEKTIHNILFIKTHMQRQDEFDAVSEDYHDLCICLEVCRN